MIRPSDETAVTRLSRPTSSEILSVISQGVEFLFDHFKGQPSIFPRRIFTPICKQITAEDISDIFRYFREANFVDCRISAYPYLQSWFAKLHGELAPDIILIDLDRSKGESERSLDMILHRTLGKIKERFGYNASPSVLASGSGGYHIIQPLKAVDLKLVDYYTKWSEDPNKEFLRFLERFLCPRADPEHYNHVSVNNCLLRVPGSVNSKTTADVRILQKWNGVRPTIKYVYGDFLAYLVDKRHEPPKVISNSWIEYCKKGPNNEKKENR